MPSTSEFQGTVSSGEGSSRATSRSPRSLFTDTRAHANGSHCAWWTRSSSGKTWRNGPGTDPIVPNSHRTRQPPWMKSGISRTGMSVPPGSMSSAARRFENRIA